MINVTRRGLLAGIVTASTAILAGTLPGAVAKTRLEATVNVIDAGIYAPDDGEIDDNPTVDKVTVEVTNDRVSDGETITPIPNIWGVNRETQVAWAARRGHYPEIQPGETVTLHLSPPRPSDAVRLKYDKPAVVRVFDKGTERREDGHFVPEDVDQEGDR